MRPVSYNEIKSLALKLSMASFDHVIELPHLDEELALWLEVALVRQLTSV